MALRKIWAFFLAVIMVFSVLPMQLFATAAGEAENTLLMKYDDRLKVSELGMTGEPVIETCAITSKKVGTNTPDDAVVVYVDGKLIAVGVGTAQVTWGTGNNAISYEITVEPATLSVLLVTGHSLAAGSKGNKEESVVCEEGQVYSTYEGPKYNFILCEGNPDNSTVNAKDVTGMGIGYGAAKKPAKINALTESGDGVRALDGALGYQWHKLSGEKVWVLNAAKGSTSLQTWQRGGYNYRHAVELFKAASGIMYNETQAGHYNLNKMGVVNYTTANGDQTWPAADYKKAFNSMWNGFREELALYDFDGDGKKDTVDCIGLAPLWSYCSIGAWDDPDPEPLSFYNRAGETYTGKVLNYYMSAFENDGVILASTVGRNWTTDADVKAYFEANPIENLYGVLENGTTHTNPTTVKDGVNADGVHYTQLGYNVQAVEIATSMYEYWTGNNALQSVKLLQGNGIDEVPESIEVPLNKSYVIVPETVPSTAKLTYKVTGDAAYYENGFVRGNHEGEAVLTIMDTAGNALKTVNVTVTEAVKDEYPHYTWDFSTPSLTNTEGITTDNTLSLHSSAVSGTNLQNCLKNGVLDLTSSQSTLKMSKAIPLDTSKAWSVELVAQAKSSTDIIGTFLATSASMSASKYMYINSKGDLMLVIKAAFTADDGSAISNEYTYFKVSDEDFAKSKLNSNFNIAEEHTYELRCASGIISYWLDGEKVGDLALSEQSSGRGNDKKHYTSKQPDYNGENFNSMTMVYWGTGSNAKPHSQGLMAKVKKLTIRAGSEMLDLRVVLSAVPAIEPIAIRPGDQITLPTPDTSDYCAKFLYWSESHNGDGPTYNAGDVYTVSSDGSVTLYAIWDHSEGSGADHEYENDICKHCGIKENHLFVWTFDDGTRTSTGGASITLTPVTTNYNGEACNNGTADVVGGVMNANLVCLEMSKALTLSETDGWYLEYSMACKEDSINQTLLAVKKRYYSHSIVLLKSGNLAMLYKTTIAGINEYWMFKVADEDFQAALPAGFNRADHHTYRLECNSGVYSYWLDGKKIGDLNTTSLLNEKNGSNHVQQGNKLNFASMDVQYMGNGSSANPTVYGLDAKIDQITICTKYHSHVATETKAKDATCTLAGNTAYWTCNVCGNFFLDSACTQEIEKDSWVVGPTDHNFTGEWVITEQTHTRKCADCNADNPNAYAHVFDNTCDADCNDCGAFRVTNTSGGDLDGVEGVTSDDAIYLLYHTLLGNDRYPVNQPVDFDKNGKVDSDDAIYLLYHTLLGNDRYPIESVSLDGKTALFVGDSISYGYSDSQNRSWAERIADTTGIIADKRAVSGTSVSNVRKAKQGIIVDQLPETGDYDFIMLHGGVNDAWSKASIGTVSDSFDPTDFDTDTFAGGLENLIYTAIKRFGGTAKIGYLINFQAPSCEKGYVSDMTDYVKMIKSVCEKWGISYFDMYNQKELNEKLDFTTKKNTPDYIHPNDSGYEILTPYIIQFMYTIQPCNPEILEKIA